MVWYILTSVSMSGLALVSGRTPSGADRILHSP
jgi:hypothetical protein